MAAPGHTFSIRAHLLLLVIGTLLPAVVIAAVLVRRVVADNRTAVEQRLLETARSLSDGRLITVFGCGGDRDRAKRPRMGAAAERLSDFTILTSDNPRSEEPAAIIDEIKAGLKGSAFQVIPDRAEAIARAIHLAHEGDTILIAGKGHEDYQIFADRTIDFDDRKVARRCLEHKLSQAAPSQPPPRRGPSPRRTG